MDELWKRFVKWKKPDTRTNIIWFHLHKGPRIDKFTETESKLMVLRKWMVGEGELFLMGTVSVWADANILEIHNGDGCTTV